MYIIRGSSAGRSICDSAASYLESDIGIKMPRDRSLYLEPAPDCGFHELHLGTDDHPVYMENTPLAGYGEIRVFPRLEELFRVIRIIDTNIMTRIPRPCRGRTRAATVLGGDLFRKPFTHRIVFLYRASS